MDETDLISKLSSYFSAELSAPVKTSGLDDEHPVPAIIIEEWDTNDLNHNNSAKAGEAFGDFDNDGKMEYEWYLNFSFRTRVEFLVRHYNEVDVSKLKEKLKQELRFISERPQGFDDELKNCVLGADGNPTYTFTEPKEAELMVSARFYGDHTVTRKPSDTQYETLEEVKNDFTFNPDS